LSQLLGGGLLKHQAGDIETVLPGLLNHLAPAQLFAIPPYGDELPAPRQAGLLWIDRDALESPTLQAPMILAPARIVFRKKKALGAA
jgi:hypothetical protein